MATAEPHAFWHPYGVHTKETEVNSIDVLTGYNKAAEPCGEVSAVIPQSSQEELICDDNHATIGSSGSSNCEKCREVVEREASHPNQQQVPVETQRLAALVERIDAFRESVKPEVEDVLNSYLAVQEPQTIEEKKWISNTISLLLDRIGLSIEFMGMQSRIYARGGVKDVKGRFAVTPNGSSKAAVAPADIHKLLPIKIIYSIPPELPGIGRGAISPPSATAAEGPNCPKLPDLDSSTLGDTWQAKVKNESTAGSRSTKPHRP